MSQWTKEKMEEVYLEVRKKAMTDPEFRKKVLENPNKTIESVAGIALPADFKVNVIEENPAYQATYVLPALLEEEMTDAELEAVAGGCGTNICTGNACGSNASC